MTLRVTSLMKALLSVLLCVTFFCIASERMTITGPAEIFGGVQRTYGQDKEGKLLIHPSRSGIID